MLEVISLGKFGLRITESKRDHTLPSSSRVLTWCAGGCWLNSWLDYVKDFKNGTWCYLAKHAALKGYTVHLPVVNCKM